MATFLEIVNRVRSDAGVATSDLSTLQSGLSDESTRFKNWVSREWERVQTTRPDWQFLRQTAQFTATANQQLYTPAQVGAAATPSFTASQFANWVRKSFRFYSDASYADEMLAAFMDWDTFRNVYVYGNMRSNASRPVVFTIAPDKSLGLGMLPDAAWKVVFEYYTKPVTLSADADVPAMPTEYHDLITARALKRYGIFMSAPEVISDAQEQIDVLWPALLADQLPKPTSGPPLA